MIIALFGPPGSGKSTLINEAQQRGLSTIDLEETHSNIPQLISQSSGDSPLIIGAADKQPSDFPPDTITILLLPEPKAAYLNRVADRNANAPDKANQDESRYYDGFAQWKHLFTHVITTTGTPSNTLDSILKLTNLNQTNIRRSSLTNI